MIESNNIKFNTTLCLLVTQSNFSFLDFIRFHVNFFFLSIILKPEDGHWPAIDLSQQGNLVQVYIQVFKHTSGHCTPPTHTHTTTTHFLMQGLIPPQAGDAFSTF